MGVIPDRALFRSLFGTLGALSLPLPPLSPFLSAETRAPPPAGQKARAPPPAGQKAKVKRRMSIGADLWEDMTIRCKYVSTFEATGVTMPLAWS